MYDQENNIITIDGREFKDIEVNGQLIIEKPKLWWPYLMDDNPAYLYEFQVKKNKIKTTITINIKPFLYFFSIDCRLNF